MCRSNFCDGTIRSWSAGVGESGWDLDAATSLVSTSVFYPCERRCPAALNHSDVFTENPEGRGRRASVERLRLRCKPRGQLVCLRRENTSEERGGSAASLDGGSQSSVRRCRRGGTRGELKVESTHLHCVCMYSEQ